MALSGGVDSAVAAALLKENDFEVIGMTMRLWDYPPECRGDAARTCCSPEDAVDARRVADKLDIAFLLLDLRKEFREEVVALFAREYVCGRTPNPCILCNDRLKFNFLMRKAEALGASLFATGHYARIDSTGPARRLLRGVDASKDQSYFLYTLDQSTMSKLAFPLGALSKREVRAKARRLGLHVSDKRESQQICFVPSGRYGDFINSFLTPEEVPGPGDIVDMRDLVIGRHQGVHHFTVGQRRGLGIAAGKPLYVTGIDAGGRRIRAGTNEDLFREGAIVSDLTWTSGEPPGRVFDCEVQIRYRQKAVPSRAELVEDGKMRLTFVRRQRAVAPGQAAVCYDGEEVLGGGCIERAAA